MTVAEWNAEQWSAFANVLLAAAAITAGAWAVYNFRKSRRLEAAKWLKELFSEFYIDDTFSNVRALFEYHYDDTLGPLIERRITDRDVPVSAEETQLLRELDTLLNYFEHLLYLEDENHLSTKDREAVFEYWFDLMSESPCGGLRRYAARFGFERLARALNAGETDYIALYGSLMASVGGQDKAELNSNLTYVGPCQINGRLFDLGDYPGLVIGKGLVEAELYTIDDLSLLAPLDDFERYDPEDRTGSLYLRRCVRLAEPGVDAWLYVYNQDTEGKAPIPSGDWKAHLRSR